jgi:hypothetical protein
MDESFDDLMEPFTIKLRKAIFYWYKAKSCPFIKVVYHQSCLPQFHVSRKLNKEKTIDWGFKNIDWSNV